MAAKTRSSVRGFTLLELLGALSDYAGNHGDLGLGATGESTDFYFGGNGTGVIISARARCKDGVPYSAYDRGRMASVSDGQSNTFLFGEKHFSAESVAQYPDDSPAYDGDHLPASCRLAGPGLRLSNGPSDVLADMFSFGSWHPGGSHFAHVDGSVRFLQFANRYDASRITRQSTRCTCARIRELIALNRWSVEALPQRQVRALDRRCSKLSTVLRLDGSTSDTRLALYFPS